MADNEKKALQLMVDAEKKLNGPKGFFGSLFGCVSNLHEISKKIDVIEAMTIPLWNATSY